MNWYYHANMNWYYDCFDLPNSNLVSWVPSNQGGLPAAKKNIYKNYIKKYIYRNGRSWQALDIAGHVLLRQLWLQYKNQS